MSLHNRFDLLSEEVQLGTCRFANRRVAVKWPVIITGNPEVKVSALVDTGADACIIHPSLLSKLGSQYSSKQCSPIRADFSVTTVQSTIEEYVDLELTADSFGTTTWRFYVLPNWSSEMVIGTDFQVHFDMITRPATGLVYSLAPPGTPTCKCRSLGTTKSRHFKKSSDKSSSELEQPVNIRFETSVRESDEEIIRKYKELNRSQAPIQVSSKVKSTVPTRVRTRRPIHIKAMSLHRVGVKTNVCHDGPILIEKNIRLPVEFGLLNASQVIDVKNGTGYMWVMNITDVPLNLPVISLAECRTVVESQSEESVFRNLQQSQN